MICINVHKSWILCTLLFITLPGCPKTVLPPIGSQVESSTQLQEDEVRIWAQTREAQRRLDASGYLYENTGLHEYINAVSHKLIPPETLEKRLAFHIQVIKNPLLNAFAYPHGAIYIHTGLLARMENEAQLATLLAHEMTHATHRHTIQSLRNLKTTAAVVSSISLVGFPVGLSGLVNLLGSVGGMAAVTGYSRSLEEEADREGFARMVKAGYDAYEAPKLFYHLKRELEQEDSEEPFFFGTHPRVQERIDSFEDMLTEPEIPQDGVREEEVFMEQIMPLLLDNVELDLISGRYASAKNGIDRYLERNSNAPKAWYFLGEIYRQRDQRQDKNLARKAYQQAISIDPSFPDPHKQLGVLYMKMGHHQKAKTELEHYLTLAPNAEDKPFIKQYLSEM